MTSPMEKLEKTQKVWLVYGYDNFSGETDILSVFKSEASAKKYLEEHKCEPCTYYQIVWEVLHD